MASLPYAQYSYRAQKDLGLVFGSPSYEPCAGFQKPDVSARTCHYSPDGCYFGYALPDRVRIVMADSATLVNDIVIPNVIEIGFSPKGTFLSTWERPQKQEEGALHKNLRIWSVETGEELTAFAQKNQEGWDLQYTASESHALRLAGPEIQVYHPSDWTQGAVDKLRVEGMTSAALSPGANPSVALFVPEKKGQPASIRIHNLQTLAAPPACQKSFFKADRVQLKWNSLGTLLLLMTQTEVDNSNKSYYGETGLFLLSAAGNFDSRIILDKEGPIHDFAWNPNSKEFCVVYGFMPAKTTLFDQRVKPVYEFGANPLNFTSWNPQGRLLALAGFGNLAGKIDIWDRRTLTKVATIDAPNTSHFDWSHDGQTILTATLSPRLRVDNGIRIWHCSGKLLHIHMQDELYQAGWRPIQRNSIPAFPPAIPAAPEPSETALSAPIKAPDAKPAGAYRPPGAQGRAAPSIFKREDEGGSRTPPRHGSPFEPSSNGYGRGGANGYGGRGGTPPVRGRGQGGRHVPGANPATAPPTGVGRGEDRKKKAKERAVREGAESGRATPVDGGKGRVPPKEESKDRSVENIPAQSEIPAAVYDPAMEAHQKKIRNLNKKLKAIDDLKERVKRGEKLEATQHKKIETEGEIRKELEVTMALVGGVVE